MSTTINIGLKHGGGFVVVLGSGIVNRIKIDRITNKEKQSQVLIHHLENIRLVMSSIAKYKVMMAESFLMHTTVKSSVMCYVLKELKSFLRAFNLMKL